MESKSKQEILNVIFSLQSDDKENLEYDRALSEMYYYLFNEELEYVTH